MHSSARRIARLGGRWAAAARVARGSAIFLIPHLVGRLLAQIGLIGIARLAGPTAFGALAAGAAVVGICATAVDGGLSGRLLQERSARAWSRDDLLPTLRLRLLLHGTAALVGALLLILGSGSVLMITATLLLALAPYGVITNAYLVNRLQDRWFSASAWLSASALLLTAGALAGLLVTRNMTLAVWAVPVLLAVLATMVPRSARIRPGFVGLQPAASMLWKARHFLVMGVAVAAYSRGDRLVLGLISGSDATGQYSAAYSLIFGVTLVGMALNAVLLPEFVRSAKEHERATRDFFHSALASLALGIGLMVAIIVAAPWLVSLLYGPSYREAAELLRILSPLAVLYCLNPVTTTLLIARGHDRVTARVARMNLALAAIFYPVGAVLLGAVGTAIASVGIELVGGCTQLLVAHRALRRLRRGAQSLPGVP